MSAGFKTDFSTLPDDLPVFPLARVILLPRVLLPLNIFEPRYIAMVDHALSTHRLIGMVQSNAALPGGVYKTGCAGRIASFNETDDGRYLITLTGISRFDIAEERPLHAGGFRHVRPDWSPYAGDAAEDKTSDICRDKLSAKLAAYFERMGLSCERWTEIRDMGCERLVSTLSVICPFEPAEKQSLLEAKTLKDRAGALMAILDLALSRMDATQTEVKTTCH